MNILSGFINALNGSLASGDASVVDAVNNVPPSPAFYVALVLYALASTAYVSAFFDSPDWMRRAAVALLVGAFIGHGVDIGWRGVQSVHPGTSVREALGFGTWVLCGGYLLYSTKYRFPIFGALLTPVLMLIFAAARLSPSGDALEDLGTLGRIHISLATVGVATFAFATALSFFYILEERNLKKKRFDGLLYKRGIALETLDQWSHRLILVGFPIFSIALLLGVIWVSQGAASWTRPEYPIALITWLTFGVVIVARTTSGFRGRRAAWLTIFGFLAAVVVLVIYFARRVG